MKPDKASKTAMHMAFFRSLESARGERMRLFYDPLARHYLTPPLYFAAAMARIPLAQTVISRYIDRHWPGARTSGIARTRAIDDILHALLAEDARQVVILGAGYDSRAYRIAEIRKATVFEVDYPATSAKKIQKTKQAIGDLPTNIRFVQIDFNQQTLETVLQEAGYVPGLKTVFIWEGVSNYLTAEAVGATLSFCAGAAAGSRIIFTYIDRRALETPQTFSGAARVSRFLKTIGEGWQFGLDPRLLSGYLQGLGLALESDLSASQYREKFFKEDSRTMNGYEFYHVAVAKVPE